MLDTLNDLKSNDGQQLTSFNVNVGMETHQDAYTYLGIDLHMKLQRGETVSHLDQFAKDRHCFIDKVVDNLKRRFPNLDLLDAMQVEFYVVLASLASYHSLLFKNQLQHSEPLCNM